MYDLSFSDVLAVSIKRWKIVLGLAAIGGAVVGALTVFVIPREWAARATIVLGNQSTNSGAISAMLSGLAGTALSNFTAQQGPTTDLYDLLLRSWDTRSRVARRLELQKVLGERSEPETIERLGRITSVDVNPPTSVSISVVLPGSPRGLFPAADSDMAIRELAVTCVNTYTEVLQAQLDGLRISSAKSQRVFLETQLPAARAKYYAAQKALADWQRREKVPSPPKIGEVLSDELADVQKALTSAEIEARAQARTASQARELLAGQPEMLVSGQTETQNPQIPLLTRSLAELEQQLAEQEIFYHKTAEHPDVQRLKVQKEEVLAQLSAAYRQQLQPTSVASARNAAYEALRGQWLNATVAKGAAEARAQGLRAALARGRQRVETLSGMSLEYARLYEDMQMAEAVYETVVKQYEAARLSEKAEEPIFFVTDPPVLPYKKTAPSTSLSVIAGLILGMVVGVAFAYWKERRGLGREPAG